MDFAMTGVEWIFLGAAVLVTVPMALFLRFIIREMRKDDAAHGSSQDKTAPKA